MIERGVLHPNIADGSRIIALETPTKTSWILDLVSLIILNSVNFFL